MNQPEYFDPLARITISHLHAFDFGHIESPENCSQGRQEID
jgi:hypothetical protein